MGQTAQIHINQVMRYEETDEMSTLTDILNQQRGLTFSEGTGANQINLIFHDQRPLANGASEWLNFQDGSLTNKVGQPITMDIFKALYVKNNSTDADLSIGGDNVEKNELGLFANATDVLVIPPGGEVVIIAPDASGIDCSVNADLKIALGTGTSAPGYDLIAIGVDSTP